MYQQKLYLFSLAGIFICNYFLKSTVDVAFSHVIKARDCRDLVGVDGMASGVYKVHPYRVPEGLFVYCDLDTDGGGWTVRYVSSICYFCLRFTWLYLS